MTYSLIQTISHISVLTSVFTPWETCAQNLIKRYRPSSVFFSCRGQLCPNNLFKTLQVPSQNIFGLESSELPTFKETDLVFLVDDKLIQWNNKTVHKYRLNGGSDFMLIVVTHMADNVENLSKSIKNLFSAMWLSGIVRCAVLLVNDMSLQVYTYQPFRDGRSCEDTTPVLLGECSDVLEKVFDLTYKTVNLNQCPIRIAAEDDRPFYYIKWFNQGRFGKLVKEVAHRMNASIENMEPASGSFGDACGPNEASGSRGMVLSGKVHIAVGSFNQHECSTLEYVGLPYTQCLTWCTPLLQRKNDIVSFTVKPFKTKVWIALVMSVAIVSVVVSFLCTVTLERWTCRDTFNLALAIYAQPSPVEPRTTPTRLLVMTWLLACLVIRSAYEGELKSQSSLRKNFRIIQDPSELVHTDIRLCSSPANLRSFVPFKGSVIVKKALEKLKHCYGSPYENMMAAAKLKDRAVFSSDLRCTLVAASLWTQNLYLHPRTGACFKTYQVSPFITLPGSPFKHRLRTIQDRCAQSGLILKWLSVSFPKKFSHGESAYSVHHLLPALFTLGVGCLVALLSFVCEKTFHRRSQFKHK